MSICTQLFSFLPPSGSSVFFTTAMIRTTVDAPGNGYKKDYIATVHSDEISYGYPRVEMAKKRIHSDGVLGRKRPRLTRPISRDDTAIIISWRDDYGSLRLFSSSTTRYYTVAREANKSMMSTCTHEMCREANKKNSWRAACMLPIHEEESVSL